MIKPVHPFLRISRVACLALVGGVLVTACDSRPVEEKREAPPTVRLQVVELQAVAERFTLPGEVLARRDSVLAFRVAGKIIERRVNLGQAVRKGDVLVRLDPADYKLAVKAQEAAVAAAEAEVKLLRTEDQRVRDLRARNLLAQSDADKAKTALDAGVSKLDAARAELAQLRHQSAYATLVADEDGVITALNVEEGQVVSAGQPVLKLAQTTEKEVLVHVPETRLEAMRQAERLRVSVAALPERTWTGRLRELASQADPATRTFAARIAIEPPHDGLALGMTARLTVSGPTREVWLVPLSAINTQSDQPAVWVMDGESHKVRRLNVTLDGLHGDLAMVGQGLQGGERVVVEGAHRLHEGQVVRPLEPKS